MTNMPNKDQVPLWLIVLGVLAGGAALAHLMTQKRSRTYSCYNCDRPVTEGMARCPNCGVVFDWSQPHHA